MPHISQNDIPNLVYRHGVDIPLLAQEILDQLRRDGVVVLRGDLDYDDYLALSNQLGSVFLPYLGGSNQGRELIDAEARVSTAPGGANNYALPLHGEMYYQKRRPELLFFYCVTPPARGGETTVADGRRIYRAIEASPVAEILGRRIHYHRRRDRATWRHLYQTSNPADVLAYCRDNGVEAVFDEALELQTCFAGTVSGTDKWGGQPAFINNLLSFGLQALRRKDRPWSWVTFDDGTAIPSEALLELEALANRLAIPHAWRQGDMLVIDNTRVLHGRHGFDAPERRIFLRMAMVH